MTDLTATTSASLTPAPELPPTTGSAVLPGVLPSAIPTAHVQDFLVTLEQLRALPDAPAQALGEALHTTTDTPPNSAADLLTSHAADTPTTLATDTEDGNDLPASDAALPDENPLVALGILPPVAAPNPAAQPIAPTGTEEGALSGEETTHPDQRDGLRGPGKHDGPAHQAAAPLVVPDKVQLPAAVTERAHALPTQAAFAQLLAVNAALEPDSAATIAETTLADPFDSAQGEPLAALPDATHPALPFTLDASTAASRAPATTPALRLELPVIHPQWGEQLAERVQWLVQGERQDARLILNPPALGPLEVHIQVDQDKATAQISFGAAHAVVRESLEAALPRLREMLGETGLTLANVEVGARGGQQAQAQGHGSERQAASHGWRDNGLADTDEPTQRIPIRRGLGLVDDFA